MVALSMGARPLAFRKVLGAWQIHLDQGGTHTLEQTWGTCGPACNQALWQDDKDVLSHTF